MEFIKIWLERTQKWLLDHRKAVRIGLIYVLPIYLGFVFIAYGKTLHSVKDLNPYLVRTKYVAHTFNLARINSRGFGRGKTYELWSDSGDRFVVPWVVMSAFGTSRDPKINADTDLEKILMPGTPIKTYVVKDYQWVTRLFRFVPRPTEAQPDRLVAKLIFSFEMAQTRLENNIRFSSATWWAFILLGLLFMTGPPALHQFLIRRKSKA